MSKKKQNQNEIVETSENFAYTLLNNFDKKYQKRILRYYYRTLRKLRKQL